MPRNHHFSFKQFTVRQELSAMKVCTDACLFGAWAELTDATRMLDIGTGTGLLSLMAAQRNPNLTIDGVEVDADAYRQSLQNIEASPFSERIKVYHTPVQEFFPSFRYDCILSNPPFFQNDLRSPSDRVNQAHHAESLDFQDLAASVERLLAPGGSFHLLLPVAESHAYERLHGPAKWSIVRELLLHHRPGMEPFRRMISFRYLREPREERPTSQYQKLYIYDEKGVNYDPSFKAYLNAFYLGF
jgi:tRNA1Val (adenine37-N6)-methyltransferase